MLACAMMCWLAGWLAACFAGEVLLLGLWKFDSGGWVVMDCRELLLVHSTHGTGYANSGRLANSITH